MEKQFSIDDCDLDSISCPPVLNSLHPHGPGACSENVGVPLLGNSCSANERVYSVTSLLSCPRRSSRCGSSRSKRKKKRAHPRRFRGNRGSCGRSGQRSWDRDNKQPFPLIPQEDAFIAEVTGRTVEKVPLVSHQSAGVRPVCGQRWVYDPDRKIDFKAFVSPLLWKLFRV